MRVLLSFLYRLLVRVTGDPPDALARFTPLPAVGNGILRTLLWLAVCSLAPTPAAWTQPPPASRPVTPAAPVKPAPGRIDARGDSVFRWDHHGAEAYLLEGRCQLDCPAGLLNGEQMLLLVEPIGDSLQDRQWHVRVAATGKLASPRSGGLPLRPGEAVWSSQWTTPTRPTVDAPFFRGPPTTRPQLLDTFAAPNAAPIAAAASRIGTSAEVASQGQVVPAAPGRFGQPDRGAAGVTRAQFELPAPQPSPAEPLIPNDPTFPSLNPPTLSSPTLSAPGAEALRLPRAEAPAERLAPAATAPQMPGLIESVPGLIESPAETAAEDARVRAMQPPVEAPRVIGPNEPLLPATPQVSDAKFQLLIGGGSQSVEIFSRGAAMPAQIETQNRPEANETVVIARGGVTVLVRDVMAQMPTGQTLDLGTITLSADRVVAWLPLVTDFISGGGSLAQAEGEFFLEGNIVFRQGERVIYANSMYYNVTRQYGMVLDAEAITPGIDFEGVVRLKAGVLQQVSRGEFIAFDAAVTSSRMGVPRYWLQSEQLTFSDQTRPAINPVTGTPTQVPDRVISSRNNFVYLSGVPVLYWPRFSSDMTVSSFYLDGIKVKRDSIFGDQLYLDWDMFQLLGFDRPPQGVEWLLSTDYLSERGPALGTTVTYSRDRLFGMNGPANGFLDAWGIRDTGLDTLGRDRVDIEPESEYRGRILGRHRQWLGNDFEWIAEIGYLSDRNFLEQYFEEEWDQDKDHDTNLRIRKYYHNNLFELAAEARVNDFFTETQRLPRLEHFLLGGSLLADRLTWSMKNQVGYADMNVATLPQDPAVAAVTQTPLPGEADASGLIASTRQEISAPLELGPIKFAPFLSGEASHYDEDMTGESVGRLIGQGGVRANLPMWRVDPNVQSSLLNVRGLSHRVEFVSELFYADSNLDFEELPLYDRLDDNAQEEFRRRFIYSTFGGVLPDRFDSRTYALRNGMQRFVTNPSEVVADDMAQARLGIHQRWQTKRGAPGRERIVDLMRFDVDTIVFPTADRDNFDETLGPTTFDFRYHVGDRVSLVSDGYFDFFADGLQSLSLGVRTSRPGVGEAYVGVLALEGPVSAQVLRTNYDYRMNEKWIISAMNTYDFSATGNIGQSIGLTRIGESFLFRLGLDIDRGRDNVGVSFMLEPRFLPNRRLGRLGGQWIPPVGLDGLE